MKADQWAADARLSVSLRQRISAQLTRIIRSYVIAITTLLAVISLMFGYYYKLDEVSRDRELIGTKLGAELSSVLSQMQSLAGSSLLWTGLSDSLGRDVYLQPLLSRFNRSAMHQYLVLDYRGRVFLGPDAAQAEHITQHPSVLRAVEKQTNAYGMGWSPMGLPQFVLVHKVMSPQSDMPVGFIVGVVDPQVVLSGLKLKLEGVSYSIAGSPLMPEPAQGLLIKDDAVLRISSADFDIDLRIWLSHSLAPSLATALMVVVLAYMLGAFTLRRVAAWASAFSASTTERLDQLVLYCRLLLAGDASAAAPAGPRDEISQVLDTLSQMLRQQKKITDELRTTSLVFSTAAEGIMVTDPQGAIVDVNPALLRMTGFARAGLIGRLSGSLYRLSGHGESQQEIAIALQSQGQWSGETSFVHQLGHDIATFISVSRIVDEQGASLGHVSVITDVGRLKKAEEALRDMAYRDALTHLPNLRMMTEQVQARLNNASRPFALLFVDLDHLKAVNDGYDHEAGDWMIRGMAEHLHRELPPGHLLCRRSGDEFIALIDRDALPTAAWEARLLKLTQARVMLPAGAMVVSATIGVARYPEDAQTWQDLQVCADVAMNAAKQAQRGSVAWYDSGLGAHVLRQRQIRNKLGPALERGAIELHYQPVVHLLSGAIMGFEALARWTDPELGVISPDEFVPIVEEAQLSDRFTLAVLQILLRDKPRIGQVFVGTVLAFNASPHVFRHAKLIEFLAEQEARSPGLLNSLEIELTESDIASSEDLLLKQLQVLTGMGVRLVIDDFGKGYSSLTRLAQYPISCLKIDSSFVSSLGQGRHTQIAELVINLAQLLGLQVTAEGVETVQQRELLLRMGCTRGQGWLYAKAMPLAQLLALPNPLPGLEVPQAQPLALA